MNYYPFHVGDYISNTAHLNIYEDLAYRRLIELYYLKESPIKIDDIKKIAKRIRMPDCDGDIEAVLNEYFTIKDDYYHHSRCDKELAKYHAKADSARANGAKGGRPKKPTITQSVILANPEETGSKANQEPEPITNNQDKPKKKGVKRFAPPLLAEVHEYITEKTYQVHAEQFVNFYESKGWMVGSNKMKDWKAAVRQWHSRNKESTPTDNRPMPKEFKGWDNEENKRPSTSRAKRVVDELDRIAAEDIAENGFTHSLD
jgi:uncharacterized protein YdaU (DUF1376 family)